MRKMLWKNVLLLLCFLQAQWAWEYLRLFPAHSASLQTLMFSLQLGYRIAPHKSCYLLRLICATNSPSVLNFLAVDGIVIEFLIYLVQFIIKISTLSLIAVRCSWVFPPMSCFWGCKAVCVGRQLHYSSFFLGHPAAAVVSVGWSTAHLHNSSRGSVGSKCSWRVQPNSRAYLFIFFFLPSFS